jgi:tRNA G10  N-methylase Trm11
LINPSFLNLAGALEGTRNGIPKRQVDISNLLVAWDATMLAVRASSVDFVLSDLPFGQRCLSLSLMYQPLPAIFCECARVLQPGRGRMILLSTPWVSIT